MTVTQTVQLIGGILAIIGVVVAVTRYLTQLQQQRKIEKAEHDLQDAQKKLETVEQQRDQLNAHVEMVSRGGGAVLELKMGLDDSLRNIMKLTGATGGSIYVPVRSPKGDPLGLVFVCIEPFTLPNQQLRKKTIPLHSLAGECFSRGEPILAENAAGKKEHFEEADKIADYRPAMSLCVPLKSGTETIGVLQLLNREGEPGFTRADRDRAAEFSKKLGGSLSVLASNVDLEKILGLSSDSEGTDGSVIVFDLSCSSLLYREFSTSEALKRMNEYFEEVCEAAFKAGGTLDNYMGDGGLLRFNVPRPLPDHELAAVRAALDMNRAFERLRSYWIKLSPRLSAIHNRIGISSGPLLRSSVGHSQVERTTIMGYPISVAAWLCEAGDRSRSIIVTSEETYKAVKTSVLAEPYDSRQLDDKTKSFTTAAYEIKALT